MPHIKIPFFAGPKDQKQPWSYSASAPSTPCAPVLRPLRKREYQTRQQQMRQGTSRRIGCPPRRQDEFLSSDQIIICPAHSSANDSPAGLGGESSNGNSNSRGSQSVSRSNGIMSSSSSFPQVHPFATSATSTSSSSTIGFQPERSDSSSMDWAPSSPRRPASSSDLQSPSPSSPLLGSSCGKGFMMMSQAMGFGAGSTSSSSSSSSSAGRDSSAGGSTNATPQGLRNAHLSVAQLGGAGRRMSTPSIPTTSRHSADDSSAAGEEGFSGSSDCRGAYATPRPSSALSIARAWVSSSATSLSLAPSSSDEFHGYYNVNLTQPHQQHQRKSNHNGYTRSDATMDLVSSRIPTIIAEREYYVEGYDKVFATTWVSNEEVLVGTKCNKIVLLNTRTDKRMTIPRLDECLLETSEIVFARVKELATEQQENQRTVLQAAQPPQHHIQRAQPQMEQSRPSLPRGVAARIYGNSINANANGNSNVSAGMGIASSLERGLRFFNAGRRSSTPSLHSPPSANLGNAASVFGGAHNIAPTPVTNDANGNVSPNIHEGAGTSRFPTSTGNIHTIAAASTSTGIRSLSINPSRTLLAIGSGDPFQVTIYSIPEFEPVGMMYGHTDLVFSLTWVSDTVLATGARDGSMRVWSMDAPVLTTLSSVAREIQVRLPVLTRSEDRTKVRDLALNKTTGQLMTLSTEGFVKLWDRESYVQLSKMKLIHQAETVCLTANSEANLFSVGSQSHISIIDPRTSGTVHIAESCDEGWGVRSLDFKSHIITTGGGYGRIGYYDLRAQRYLDGFDNGESPRRYQEIGSGWLNRDTAYAGSIVGITIRNAVYAMEYDPTGTRLFVAGGPLQLGLCGAYVGLWA